METLRAGRQTGQIAEAFVTGQSTLTIVRQRKPYVDFIPMQTEKGKKSEMVRAGNKTPRDSNIRGLALLQIGITRALKNHSEPAKTTAKPHISHKIG
jgi:hypothetical protein